MENDGEEEIINKEERYGMVNDVVIVTGLLPKNWDGVDDIKE